MIVLEDGVLGQSTLSTQEAAKKWNTTPECVRSWCKSKHVSGALKSKSFPFAWSIPADAKRPIDAAIIRELLWQIVEFQNSQLVAFDLSEWGISDSDVSGCIGVLADAGYLVPKDESSYRLSRRALAVVGRSLDKEEKRDALPILAWCAASGTFAGAFVKQLL